MADKKRRTLLIDEDVYVDLVKKRGELEAKVGKRMSFSEFISYLLKKD